jgi:hypothetical protein
MNAVALKSKVTSGARMAEKSIRCRNATREDLPGILQVEESWPEGSRAGADKFLARLERFPEGFFVACLSDKVVATITAMPAAYDAQQLERYRDWASATNDGYLFERKGLEGCNALYIVSGVIDKDYRSLNIFDPMVLNEVHLARRLGLRYVLAGAVLPGFRAYVETHGEIAPYAYCTTRRGTRLVDPLLAMYERIGFSVPDARHVIPGYYLDDASRNHAALVVRHL